MFRRLGYILFLVRSIPKTLVFNVKYFPLSVARKLPVIISHRTILSKLSGSVEIQGKVTTGMITIGFGDVAMFDRKRSRSIWKNQGSIIFRGKAQIGHGTKIGVGIKANLIFGENFMITAETQIACKHKITFGNDNLLSWDILIIDSDFHRVFDSSGNRINEDEEIRFGNHVWIGARSVVKKGIFLADNTIISAQSVVVKNVSESNQVWGGNPAKLIRENVSWKA